VDDLIGIAAEQEVAGLAQGLERQGKLGVGEVLHLVDNKEVVARLGRLGPGVGDKARVVKAGLGEPGPVLLEQVIESVAGLDREDRLAHAEAAVGLTGQDAARVGRDHPTDLLDGFAVEGGSFGPVDCNDSDASVNPATAEDCTNGVDDNCDGRVDDADPACAACVPTRRVEKRGACGDGRDDD